MTLGQWLLLPIVMTFACGGGGAPNQTPTCAGQPCSTQGNCDANYTPTATLPMGCSNYGDAAAVTQTTCDPLTLTCIDAVNLQLAQTCKLASQCSSRVCDPLNSGIGFGWCSKPCSNSTVCDSFTACVDENDAFEANHRGSLGKRCMPQCFQDQDCGVYGFLCVPTVDVVGNSVNVCWRGN